VEKLRLRAPEGLQSCWTLFALCIFMAERFTQAFYKKGTRKYLKPGSVPAIRKKNISNHI